MLRLCCFVLIAFASASVAARDFKHSSPNGGGCSDEVVDVTAANKAKLRPAHTPAPARATKPRPALSGDTGSRPAALRWHSFLPGMFR